MSLDAKTFTLTRIAAAGLRTRLPFGVGAGVLAAMDAPVDIAVITGPGAVAGTIPGPEVEYDDPRTGYMTGDLVFDSANGNNANTGTLASPKASIQSSDITYALANNRRIWLRGHQGQIYTAGLDSYTVYRNRDASSDARMTIATYPGDPNATWTNTSALDSMQFQSSYWDFRRLHIIARGSGRDGFFLGENSSALNCRFIECTGYNNPVATDNSGCIHAKNTNSDGLEVIKCVWSGGTAGAGTAAVLLFALRRYKVIGNLFATNHQGLYGKHDHTATSSDQVDIVMRNNIHYTPSYPLLLNSNWAVVDNELIINVGTASDNDDNVRWGDESGNAGGHGASMNHCTLIGSSLFLDSRGATGDLDQPTDFVFRNSIICDSVGRTSRRLMSGRYTSEDLRTVSDYNLYQTNSFLITNTTVNLSQRQSGGNDTHSVIGTPVFVGSDPAIPAHWALQVGSPGKGAASDATDMGVDVTKLLTVAAAA